MLYSVLERRDVAVEPFKTVSQLYVYTIGSLFKQQILFCIIFS